MSTLQTNSSQSQLPGRPHPNQEGAIPIGPGLMPFSPGRPVESAGTEIRGICKGSSSRLDYSAEVNFFPFAARLKRSFKGTALNHAYATSLIYVTYPLNEHDPEHRLSWFPVEVPRRTRVQNGTWPRPFGQDDAADQRVAIA